MIIIQVMFPCSLNKHAYTHTQAAKEQKVYIFSVDIFSFFFDQRLFKMIYSLLLLVSFFIPGGVI